MTRKQVRSGSPPPTTLVVGLDMGYGYTKAVTENYSVSFPSVIGHARTIRFNAKEIAEKYPGMSLTDGVDALFIGELALSQLNTNALRRLRSRATAHDNEMATNFRRRLMFAALGRIGEHLRIEDTVHVIISTGLPVDHMADAASLKSLLIGPHSVMTDRAAFVAHVSDVRIMPQPYGSIYSEMLLPDGALNARYTHTRTGVIDIGTYTVDLTVDDDGEFVAGSSGSLEAGIHMAEDAISEGINNRHRARATQRQIDEVLRTGYLIAYGQREDWRREVSNALKPLQDAVIALATERWDSGLNLDRVQVTGGGAPLVFDALRAIYPQAVMLPDPHLANARGYLRYARFKARSG
ncbi:MAG: ParM/StbA family protein [Chloroflexota bacterium]|nr:ParM/StbA family protein [Chloroflexota bacterium]